MENIFNNNIKVLGGVSATMLNSPTLDIKINKDELNLYANKEFVDESIAELAMKILFPIYTGHADLIGLRKIGWTDEDILYYQIYGVNWNEEEDHLHKVPQNNIDLYGTINASNIQTYSDILVYLPKIDTSQVTDFGMFHGCTSLTSIPSLDTSQGTDFNSMFGRCLSLTSIPLLDTSQGTNFGYMFRDCSSLTSIPLLDTSQGTQFGGMFSSCRSLTTIPLLDTSSGTDFSYMFNSCSSLISIPSLDTSKGTNFSGMFYKCYILSEVNLQGLPLSIDLQYINQVTINKESILFIINNSTATSAITITLDATNYGIYSVDADVIAALTSKSLVTLVQ